MLAVHDASGLEPGRHGHSLLVELAPRLRNGLISGHKGDSPITLRRMFNPAGYCPHLYWTDQDLKRLRAGPLVDSITGSRA